MRDNMEQRARELAVYIIEQDHHPRRGQALWHFQVNDANGELRSIIDLVDFNEVYNCQ